MNQKYGCLLLAGGKGSRMGGLNKAELVINRETFASKIESELSETGMQCYISQCAFQQDIPEGWMKVDDLYFGSEGEALGPAAGICSGLLQAKKDGLAGLFCVPCDAPFFDADVIEKMKKFITEETDAVWIRTSDERIQTVFGWYSVNCILPMETDLKRGMSKLRLMLKDVNLRIVDAKDAGMDERCFTNINRREDYEKNCNGRMHIVIEGEKRAGKSTLINRLINETDYRIYGYKTKILKTDEQGYHHVYMYPAAEEKTEAQEIGITRQKVVSVNTDVFENFGVKLLSDAADGIIIMDEIGFMETNAERFCQKVTETFDHTIPVIAAIKQPDHGNKWLRSIKKHPKVYLLRLNENNREEIYETAKRIMKTWKGGEK